jgi:hypothetical protein
MLYGTGRMLQLSKTNHNPSPLRQILFGAFQVLEANRAIMYGEETFLSGHEWSEEGGAQLFHAGQCFAKPMNEIITLMIYTASFSQRYAHDTGGAKKVSNRLNRFFCQIDSVQVPEPSNHPDIKALGLEGVRIQSRLKGWFLQYNEVLTTSNAVHESKLSLIYFHTLLLFLSRNYTYYPYWSDSSAPLLEGGSIFNHTRCASDLMEQLLHTSCIPGVMLLFPLRVVGSLLSQTAERTRLMAQLDTIRCKGYAVADRVKTDLQELWALPSLPSTA